MAVCRRPNSRQQGWREKARGNVQALFAEHVPAMTQAVGNEPDKHKDSQARSEPRSGTAAIGVSGYTGAFGRNDGIYCVT